MGSRRRSAGKRIETSWDAGRRLQYRRVDRYLTPLAVPLNDGATRSFHRPLHAYINALAECGLLVDRMDEITSYKTHGDRAERQAEGEFPLFLGLRARKVGAREESVTQS